MVARGCRASATGPCAPGCGPGGRSGSSDAAGPLDAMFVHTQVPAILVPDRLRRIPTVVSLDATPIQYDELGAHYDHDTGSAPRRAPEVAGEPGLLRRAAAHRHVGGVDQAWPRRPLRRARRQDHRDPAGRRLRAVGRVGGRTVQPTRRTGRASCSSAATSRARVASSLLDAVRRLRRGRRRRRARPRHPRPRSPPSRGSASTTGSDRTAPS